MNKGKIICVVSNHQQIIGELKEYASISDETINLFNPRYVLQREHPITKETATALVAPIGLPKIMRIRRIELAYECEEDNLIKVYNDSTLKTE